MLHIEVHNASENQWRLIIEAIQRAFKNAPVREKVQIECIPKTRLVTLQGQLNHGPYLRVYADVIWGPEALVAEAELPVQVILMRLSTPPIGES